MEFHESISALRGDFLRRGARFTWFRLAGAETAWEKEEGLNGRQGDDVIIVPSLKDEAEIKRLFPKGYKAIKPYLRVTPQPNL